MADEPRPADSVPPWTAAMLATTSFSRTGRGARAGYEPGEVDDFVERAVARVAWLERENARLARDVTATREALRLRADTDAAERNAARSGPPTMATDVIAQAQTEAERILDRAHADAAQIRAGAVGDGLARPDRTGDLATDFLRHAQWLAEAGPELRQRIADLQALAGELEAERDRIAEVLPLAQAALPVPVLDVREIDTVAS